MAKRRIAKRHPRWRMIKILTGGFIFTAGLLRHLEILGWAEIAMTAGAIIVVIGVFVKK